MGRIGHRPTNYKYLRFEKNVQGCDLCVSHKVNPDGYVRKMWIDGLEFLHRRIYRAVHGITEWPKGHTIHHLCGNRACCNTAHMVMMKHGDHARHHNCYREFQINEWQKETH